MNLLLLAPDIQEEILFLARTIEGRDPVTERMIRSILQTLSLPKQRQRWADLQSR